jgi:hypothetical protein
MKQRGGLLRTVVVNDCWVQTVCQSLTSVFHCFASCDSQCNIYCILTLVLRVGLKWFNYPNITEGIDKTVTLIFESLSTIAEFRRYVKVLQAFFACSPLCDSQCNIYCILTLVLRVGLKRFNYLNIAQGIGWTKHLYSNRRQQLPSSDGTSKSYKHFLLLCFLWLTVQYIL